MLSQMPPANFHNCYPYAPDVFPHMVMPPYVEQYYDEKPVQADRYKTRLCDKFFETNGHCPYGIRCMFAHGEQELRTVEDNLRDGLVSEGAIRRFRQRYYLHSFNSSLSCPYAPSFADLPPPPSYDSLAIGSWEEIPNNCTSCCCPSLPPPPPYEASGEKYRHNPYQSVIDEVDEPSSFSSSVTSMEESENSESFFFPTGHLSSPSSCSESVNGGEWKNEVNSLSHEVAVMPVCA